MNSIERGWYNGSLLNYLLAPLSLLFFVVAGLRKLSYQLGLSKSHKAKVPVIIVGNISVGGNGKTPFVIRLVQLLQSEGIKVGVISRGYGSKSEHYPAAVTEMNTAKYGDEPVLIHKRTGCPIVVGSDRVQSCDHLVEQYGCDVIVSDDGMQHYRLKRDMEIAIVDGNREFGNGWLMPVGPLRELKSRLNTVDHIIYNGHRDHALSYQIKAGQPRSVLDGKPIPDHLIKKVTVNAICGIGNPQRFKQTVTSMGYTIKSFHGFADHYHYQAEDFTAFADEVVLMTEKDAVKCQPFARPNWWYIPIDAELPNAFEAKLLNQIKKVIDAHGI
jgi:tetraacyldisaccharide 4'-kinase